MSLTSISVSAGRIAQSVAASGIALITIALVGACGGNGGSPTLQTYFEDLQHLDNGQSESAAALDAELAAVGRDDVPGGLAIVRRQNDLRGRFVDGMEDISPPDEVAALHDETVDGLRREIAAYRAFLEAASGATNAVDLLAIVPQFDNAAIAAAQNSCSALETYAGENGIALDLDCSEP